MIFNQTIAGSDSGGTTPTGTIEITANGTYDVAQYASADVQVASDDPYPVRNDGKTHLWVMVDDLTLPTVALYYAQSTAGGLTVDWGDGTVNVPVTTAKGYASHDYAETGLYEIVLYSESGAYMNYTGAYGTTSGYCVMGTARADSNEYNRGRLKAVELSNFGSTAARRLIGHALYNCLNVEKVTLSGAFTEFSERDVVLFPKLERLSLPDTVTTISLRRSANSDNLLVSLRKVRMPSGLTSIESDLFSSSQLASIDIPASVGTINANAFADCAFLTEIRFHPTTPPTVVDATAWTNLPTTCEIHVPSGTLADYTAAANYPDPATYTYVED